MDHPDDAEHIGLIYPAHVVGGDVGRRNPPASNAGVVDQNIEPARLGSDPSDRRRNGRVVGDIQLNEPPTQRIGGGLAAIRIPGNPYRPYDPIRADVERPRSRAPCWRR